MPINEISIQTTKLFLLAADSSSICPNVVCLSVVNKLKNAC